MQGHNRGFEVFSDDKEEVLKFSEQEGPPELIITSDFEHEGRTGSDQLRTLAHPIRKETAFTLLPVKGNGNFHWAGQSYTRVVSRGGLVGREGFFKE